jgi:hypothetical protein
VYGTAALVETAVVTVTVTIPAVEGGAVAVICESLFVMNKADVVPNITMVVPVNSEPVMITLFPPAVEPVVGLSRVTVGGPAAKAGMLIARSPTRATTRRSANRRVRWGGAEPRSGMFDGNKTVSLSGDPR